MSTVFPREKDALAFYGAPGTGQVRIKPPYQLYFGDQKVSTILIHGKCADSAMRAMERIARAYSPADIHRLGFDAFAGCFNDRDKRGGTTKSMHAYACAIDWNAGKNSLRADHRTASFAKPECKAFLDAWEAEGWTSLGRFKDFDWMHVQAARP